MRLRTAAVVAALAAFATAEAGEAAIETTTTGTVCCPFHAGQLENFGGYKFRGRTRPSQAGQFVYFLYKRPAATRWHKFKVGLGGSDGPGFYVLNKNRPRDAINRRHRWSVYFTPSVRQGYWKIRARFPSQDGYARSAVTKRYWVWQSE